MSHLFYCVCRAFYEFVNKHAVEEEEQEDIEPWPPGDQHPGIT